MQKDHPHVCVSTCAMPWPDASRSSGGGRGGRPRGLRPRCGRPPSVRCPAVLRPLLPVQWTAPAHAANAVPLLPFVARVQPLGCCSVPQSSSSLKPFFFPCKRRQVSHRSHSCGATHGGRPPPLSRCALVSAAYVQDCAEAQRGGSGQPKRLFTPRPQPPARRVISQSAESRNPLN